MGHGNPVAQRQGRKLHGLTEEKRVTGDEKGLGPLAKQGSEGCLDFTAGTGVECENLQSDGACSFPYLL